MMKKLLTMSLLLGFTFFASAQISYGVKGGLNFASAKISGSNSGSGLSVEVDTKVRTSIYLGGIAEFQLNRPKQSVQIELLYSQIGTKIDESSLFDETVIKISQLTIPVLGKYQLNDDFSLYAGPYFGFNLNIEEKDVDSGETNDDVQDDYNKLDLGLVLGVEYMINENIFAEARYNYGLANNVDSDVYAGTGAELEYKNRLFQIGLGYKFL